MSGIKVSTWCGRPITELNKEELIFVIEWLGKERERIRVNQHETNKFLQSGLKTYWLNGDIE